MTTHVAAELSEDIACSRTVSRPLVSITYCAPRPPVNSSNADTGSPSAGLTVWVAPSSDANSRRAALTSTAMTRATGVSAAAMTATRPTPPAPKTTRVLPGSGRATLRIAPAPVWTLQPSGATCARSTSSSTFTADLALSKACVANDDWPKKCP